MGSLTLSELKNVSEGRTFTKTPVFTLKDDGDYALVRFLYASPDEVESYYTHGAKVTPNAKYDQLVKCNDKGCTFCREGKAKSAKVFVVLENLSDNNQIQVWTRPAKFGQVLLDLFEEFGDRLCDFTFKVKRSGAKGSKDTTYMVTPPRNNESPVDLDEYTLPIIGEPVVYAKSNEDMEEYLSSGSFPFNKGKKDGGEKVVPKVRRPVEEDEDEDE